MARYDNAAKAFRSPAPRARNKRKKGATATRLHPFLHLQQTLGNQAVGRILQAKLQVSQPGDRYEQEANRVAEQVMRMPDPDQKPEQTLSISPCSSCTDEIERENQFQSKPLAAPSHPWIQRQPDKAKIEDELVKAFLANSTTVQRQVNKAEKMDEDEDMKLMRAKVADEQTPESDKSLEANIRSLDSGGRPLPLAVRRFMDPRFGHDFSRVRVHTDAKAAEMARGVNAKAFTVGRNVVLGAGEYAPGTLAGNRLLAHELTHVIQQHGGTSKLQRRIMVNGKPYTPRTKYYAYLENNFGPHMKEFIRKMHNLGNPPDFHFKSFEQMGFEVRVRHQAIKGIEEVHSGCCNYPDSVHPDYLDSTYWDRLGWMHFKTKSPLPPGKEASDAIEAIFAPHAGTRLECLSMTIAIEYYSLLKGLGETKFNSMFPGGSGIEISVNASHPLLSGPQKKYKVLALPNKNELLPGDWVYFKNFSDYLTKHPGGAWQGENAIYLGGGMYRGFGVSSLSEADMNKELVKAYNRGLPAADQKTVADLLAEGGGLWLNPIIRPEIAKIVP